MRQRRRVRRNPDDTAAVLLGIAALGVAGFGISQMMGRDPAASILPALPGGQPQQPGAASPPAAARPPQQPAATDLTLEVGPLPAARAVGAVVTFTGLLTRRGGGPVGNAAVALVDPTRNQAFAGGTTNAQGQYRISRPLQADELDGYRVYAYFAGSDGLAAARTGEWTVQTVALPGGQAPLEPAATELTLTVWPTQPPAQTGAEVSFWGRLTGPNGPIVNASVALADPDRGDAEYQWATTDGAGEYRMRRPLQIEELGGYRVYARFNGSPGFTAARTGVWTVAPAPLSGGDPNAPA